MSSFNPTVIRLGNRDMLTGMVITDSLDGLTYFQIYSNRTNGRTFLEYAMPWTTEKGATEEFDHWQTTGERSWNG